MLGMLVKCVLGPLIREISRRRTQANKFNKQWLIAPFGRRTRCTGALYQTEWEH